MKVRIVKCDRPESWYYGKEGDVYSVTPSFDKNWWSTDKEPVFGEKDGQIFMQLCIVLKQDCEIIDEEEES